MFMDRLNIEIVQCPNHSYKLVGYGISEYYEEALDSANELYLSLYDRAYRLLMFDDFNPLWTFSLIEKNKIDPRDGFWDINYFYFNLALIKKLNDIYHLKIIDRTNRGFVNHEYLFRFFNDNNIEATCSREETKTHHRGFKTRLKKFIDGSFQKASEKKDEYKRLLSSGVEIISRSSKKRKLYLYIYPVGNMSLSAYLRWRYHDILEKFKKDDVEIILVSIKDFKDSDQVDYKFINVNRLLSKVDLLRILYKSKKLERLAEQKIQQELNRKDLKLEYEFFLRNVPTYYFEILKQIEGFSRFFKNVGPGILLYVGPVVNKGTPAIINLARKYNTRVLSIAGRILTSKRLSNLISKAQSEKTYPDVLPHSMLVFDRISEEVMNNQHANIRLYTLKKNEVEEIAYCNDSGKTARKDPCRVTLVLQKKRESREMIEEVISAINDKENIILNLKMHPNFPIHPKYINKYREFSFVNFLPSDISINGAIEKTDVCISAYSSATFEFAKRNRPVVWITYITLNSLFLTDVKDSFGLKAKNRTELTSIIRNLANKPHYYKQMQKKIHADVKNLFNFSSTITDSIDNIIGSEFNKVETI